MNPGWYRGCLWTISLVATGCLSPVHTRFPQWHAGHPAAEKRSWELHDPLPAPEFGPQTQSRPRGFIVPRAETRRSLESIRLPTVQPQLGPATTQPPETSSQYPNVVQP